MAKPAVHTLGFIAPFFCAFLVSAQYGTAPDGYYPLDFHGSTFTGVITDLSGDQVTLTQMRKGKVETFTGRLDSCSIPQSTGAPTKYKAADLPRSVQMTVFFNTVTKKDDNQKVKENHVIGFTLNEDQGGKAVPRERRKMFRCS